MNNLLIRFNFHTLILTFNKSFITIILIDLFILIFYFSIFHFNKITLIGTENRIYNNYHSHLDLSKCIGIAYIKRNNEILFDGLNLNTNQFFDYIEQIKINNDSYLIVSCCHNTDLSLMFEIINGLGPIKIPKVYITYNS